MKKLLISTILFTLFIPFMLVVTLFFNRDLVHSAQDGYITVESGGQLGNQMFDIATVLAYAHNQLTIAITFFFGLTPPSVLFRSQYTGQTTLTIQSFRII